VFLYEKEKEVEKKVFDNRTITTILKLKSKGIIKYIENILKEGKESVVVLGRDLNENPIAIKVYRVLHCDFKRMYNLLIIDPRYRNVKKSRYNIVYKWAEREFENMKIAFEAKIKMPKPISFLDNVLVMEFLGRENFSFKRLSDVKLEKETAEKIFNDIINDFKKLYKVGLAHGDLSAFNILFDEQNLSHYIIDFSHGVTKDSYLFQNLIERDLENLLKYFGKYLNVSKENINLND